MSYAKQEVHNVDELVEAKPPIGLRTKTAVVKCLVVSTSRPRRDMFMQAAAREGWDTVACPDAESATAQVRRSRFQLALIDFEGCEERAPSWLCRLCPRLSSSNDPLLVVCGHEGDAAEELWARQLGVWLYLPGVTNGDDISVLCGEARGILKQLAGKKGGGAQKAGEVNS